MAVPLHNSEGGVVAAISVSQALSSRVRWNDTELLKSLKEAAFSIENDALS
jgi:DNA-binding IclR family transcriptional regulator